MNNEEFVNEIKSMLGSVKAEAYKAGFTDGIAFVTEPSENLLKATDKAVDHVLNQVKDLYGMGKEYKVVKECLDAVLYDLKAAAFLDKRKPMSDYWDDEYGDEL